jgi:molybdate transport system substrate-binding protein
MSTSPCRWLRLELPAWALIVVAATAAPAAADELMVFAAASLTDALTEVDRGFEASSDTKVLLNLAASSDLARQIRAGAPADVFFSADRAQMGSLVDAGLVRSAEQVALLSNTLVVIVPRTSTLKLVRPEDLRQVRRLALADPAVVPAGVYARTWLESLDLWRELADRVVATLNVRAALDAVESENVDAGVVYRTDAALARRSRIAFEVPADKGPRITYVVAPLSGTSSPHARPFVRYLRSKAARTVFERHGFLVLP